MRLLRVVNNENAAVCRGCGGGLLPALKPVAPGGSSCEMPEKMTKWEFSQAWKPFADVISGALADASVEAQR